jgi:hypothetical protein
MPRLKPPNIKVRFIAPGEATPVRKRRPTRAEIGLHADMSQFYEMKAVLEEAFGHPVCQSARNFDPDSAWGSANITNNINYLTG